MTRYERPNGVVELRPDAGMVLYADGIISVFVLVGLRGNEAKWQEFTREEAESKAEEYELMNEELDDAAALSVLLGGAK